MASTSELLSNHTASRTVHFGKKTITVDPHDGHRFKEKKDHNIDFDEQLKKLTCQSEKN